MKKNTLIIFSCFFVVALATMYLSGTDSGLKDSTKKIERAELVQPSMYSNLIALLEINDKSEKVVQLNRFFQKHISSNVFEVLAVIAKLESHNDRQLTYDLALAIWFGYDAYALSQWLSNEPSFVDLDPALNNLIIASSNVKHSLLFADKISVPSIRKEALTKIFNAWATLDAKHIVHWSIEKRKDSATWLANAFKLFNSESHLTAIKSLAYMNAENLAQVGTALQTMIDNYTFGVVKGDALAALQVLEPYKIREEAIVALLPLYTNERHLSLEEITALVDSLSPGTSKDELYKLLALNWTSKNPIEAGELARSLTGETRAKALSAVVESWAKKDLESADEWLKNVDGDIDLASSTIARASAKLGNIQISDEWLDDIIEEDVRDAAIKDVLQSYYKESPASGIYHLVYQKNLTVEKKLKLLHEIYPDEFFLSPNQALDEIGRLEGLKGIY